MKISKLILPAIITAVILLVYFNYFAPTNKLGSFSKFSTNSEVNQTINVSVVKSKGFEKDESGGIISFYAKDINNVEVKVNFHEPVSEKNLNSEVIALLGHMHANSFTASGISVIK